MDEDKIIKKKLDEEQALALAEEQGIKFVDYWTVEGEVNEMGIEKVFWSVEEAEEASKGKKAIVQYRRQVEVEE